ncbi:MAG: hypothetical protein HY318_06965 [Armatimonadetes bacterium]|nr:hypothetical protein [Armatimonadota bacterium]
MQEEASQPSPTCVIAWVATLACITGPFLPWTYTSSAARAIYESLFSQVSRPNPEWWIWFLAPLAAAILGAKDLLRKRQVGIAVLVPCGVFLIAWVGLLLTGYRAYTGFRHPGFLVTFLGVLGLAGAALTGCCGTKTKGDAGVPLGS